MTETLTLQRSLLQRSLVVASLTVLAHGSMPWESRTMVAVPVQGAPRNQDLMPVDGSPRGPPFWQD